MDPTPPPIQNQGTPCPNCGAYRPFNQAYCANCGFGASKHPSANSGLTVLWIVLFIIIGLPAGCMGGCFLLVGIAPGPGGTDPSFWAIVIVGFLVFFLLLWLLIRSLRGKK